MYLLIVMAKSKLLFIFCISFIGGIFISTFFDLPKILILCLIGTGVMMLFFLYKNAVIFAAGLIIIGLILGFWRAYEFKDKIDENHISFYNGEEVSLEGVVLSEVSKKKSKIEFELGKIWLEGREIGGKVLIFLPRYSDVKYGDLLKVKGKLIEPQGFENFDYKGYLSQFKVYSQMFSPKVEVREHDKANFLLSEIFKVKEKFNESLARSVPEPESSFARKLTSGEKNSLDDDVIEAFKETGMSHVIAISGLHVSLIAALILAVGNKVNRKVSLIVTVIFISIYVVFTGASASVVRAGIMGSLIILSSNVGRLSNIRNAIVLAGVAILAINPMLLEYNVGLHLSFLSVFGIVYIAPFMQKVLKFLPSSFKVREVFAITLSAQLVTLPIVLFNFKVISLISPIANFLILPSIPISMIFSFFAGFAGMLFPEIGIFLGLFAWVPLTYGIRVAEWCSKIPFSSFQFKRIDFALVFVYYLSIAVFYLFYKHFCNLKKIKGVV